MRETPGKCSQILPGARTLSDPAPAGGRGKAGHLLSGNAGTLVAELVSGLEFVEHSYPLER